MRHRFTCEDILSLLFEYLDQEIEEEVIYSIESHRSSCPYCSKVIRTYRLIIQCLKDTEDKDVPESVHKSLLKIILREFQE